MSAIRHGLTALVMSVVLTGCQEDADEKAGADSDIPAIFAPQRAACEEEGGRWGRVPDRETFVCYRMTRDANERCDSKRDCEGLCLARSRTCAPQMPLFGCHEVISASGIRQTLCTE